MIRTPLVAAAALVAASLLPGAALRAADPTILDLAPESAVIVVGTSDLAQMRARVGRTAIGELWRSDAMEEQRRQMLDSIEEGLESMAESLGVEVESFATPEGEVALALFPVMNEELGLPMPGFLAVADFGGGAAGMKQVLQGGMTRLSEEDDVAFEEIEILGRTVIAFVPPLDEAADEMIGDADDGEDDDWDEEEWDAGGGGMMPDPDDLLRGIEKVFLVWEGERLVWSSSLDALTGALESFDGVDRPRLARRDDFRAVHDRIGDGDLYAVMLTRDLGSLVAGADPMGMSMMVAPMLSQFVGSFAGAGMSMRFDASSAMVEQTAFISMPRGKAGLTALVDHGTPRAAPPTFVPADALSYSRMNMDFSGLGALVGQIAAMLPMMMEMDPNQPGPADLVARFASCLGDEVHVVQSVERPIRAGSMQQTIAIRCTKPAELDGMLTELGAAIGMEPRDFLGHRIFTMDLSGMADAAMGGMIEAPPVAIGLGAGWLFAGPAPSVEGALRSLDDRDRARLGEEAAFARAAALVGADPVVAWGYSDPVGIADVQRQAAEAQMRDLEALLGPDALGDLDAGFGAAGAILAGLDAEVLRRHLGPSAWSLRSVEDGFLMKAWALEAEDE